MEAFDLQLHPAGDEAETLLELLDATKKHGFAVVEEGVSSLLPDTGADDV